MTVDRAALIQAAAIELFGVTFPGHGFMRTRRYEYATLVVDAVLPLIAGAIEQESDRGDREGAAEASYTMGFARGEHYAAELVRSFLEPSCE